MTSNDDPIVPSTIDRLDEWIEQTLQEQPLHPPGQLEMLKPHLIQELQAFCQEPAQAVDRSLERVRDRLERRTVGPQLRGWQEPALQAVPEFSQERQRHVPNCFPRLRSPRRWTARISTLAAAVLLVVLVGGLIAGLFLVRHGGNQTGQAPISTRASSPTPTCTTSSPGGDASVQFDDLHMIDATTGWALVTSSTSHDYLVLRTTDGGCHWKDVSPKGIVAQVHADSASFQPLGGPGSLQNPQKFLTGSVAWLAALPDQFFETKNGGQTWQQVTAPVEIAQYNFLNAQEGWVVGKGWAIYQTTNGGKDWHKLSGNLPRTDNFSGLTFRTPSDGWMTGLSMQADAPWVYVTHDGGQTWQQQHVSLPAGKIDYSYAEPPAFVSGQEGFLYLTIVPPSGAGKSELYATHDGGATWQDVSTLPGFSDGGYVTFSDGLHGWAAVGTSQPDGAVLYRLWVTNDGGQTWQQRPTSSNFTAIRPPLDFVSELLGWVVSAAEPGPAILLKTQDGGRTWKQISYSIAAWLLRGRLIKMSLSLSAWFL